MKHAPVRIGNGTVIAFTAIDDRHRPTGACRHIVGGKLQAAAAGLAICKYDSDAGYYLFYCDPEWNAITDTYHDSLEAAIRQADFEYRGTSSTWQFSEVNHL